MSSSKARRRSTLPPEGRLLALGFDPEALLVRDTGLLFDPSFLGALHAELVEELGYEEARPSLLQIGFLHGLREAVRVVSVSLEGHRDRIGAPELSPLAIRLRTATGARPRGALQLVGCWPERIEASAHLATLGAHSEPVCAVSAGYTSGWLSGVLEADVLALETSCGATGGESCSFVAREVGAWRSRRNARARALLEALPFAPLREMVQAQRETLELPAETGVNSDEAVVHVWGPVMILPFAGPDEALAAVDLVGREPGSERICVVVVDLTGAIVDEAFGASALEQIVEMLESRGVEVLLAGVSPLSERTVRGLAERPLVVHKDLHHAIAAAFQVAEVHDRPL
jgi:hypothetical protein